MAEEIDGRLPEDTLFVLDNKPLSRSHSSKVLKWHWCSCILQEKTRINVAEVKTFQDAVHQALKGGPRISQVKAGVVEGVGTKRHKDCCLWNAFWVDRIIW